MPLQESVRKQLHSFRVKFTQDPAWEQGFAIVAVALLCMAAAIIRRRMIAPVPETVSAVDPDDDSDDDLPPGIKVSAPGRMKKAGRCNENGKSSRYASLSDTSESMLRQGDTMEEEPEVGTRSEISMANHWKNLRRSLEVLPSDGMHAMDEDEEVEFAHELTELGGMPSQAEARSCSLSHTSI